jgi:predicted DNA binding CopG/RHH family protein
MPDFDKFNNEQVVLTRQTLLPGFEHGQYEPKQVYDKTELRPQLIEELGRRDSRLNVRISGKDLAVLQQLALNEQVPLQSYVANLIHHFSQGLLVYVADQQNGTHLRSVDWRANEAAESLEKPQQSATDLP